MSSNQRTVCLDARSSEGQDHSIPSGLRKVLAGGLACLVFIVPFRNDAWKRYLRM